MYDVLQNSFAKYLRLKTTVTMALKLNILWFLYDMKKNKGWPIILAPVIYFGSLQ